MSTYFIICLILFILLMLMRVPIWCSCSLACVVYLLAEGVPLTALATTMCSGGITSFVLLAFPLFSLAGSFMNSGNISKKIFEWADVNFGWITGGLGQVNVVASFLFAGMSGSAVADISGLGRVEMMGMRENGYDVEFSTGITLASSMLGPIIPPSTPMILYSVSTGVSVLSLFVGGIVPGLIIAISLMTMVFLFSKKKNYRKNAFPTFREHLQSWKSAILSMLTPVIILLGMFTGIVTPTEAAAIAVVYSLIIGAFVHRDINWKKFGRDMKNSAYFCSNIYAIIASSFVLSFIMTRENVGQFLANIVVASGAPQILVIFMLLVIVLIFGCFIEVSAMIVLILPILSPIVRAIGYPELTFGIIFVLTSVMGILTPPFGLGLFMGADISGLSFQKVFKSVAPFFIPLCLVIILLVIFPQLVTFLPSILL